MILYLISMFMRVSVYLAGVRKYMIVSKYSFMGREYEKNRE